MKSSYSNIQQMLSIKSGKEYRIIVRAADRSGNKQPKDATWNEKGDGYNASMEITVRGNEKPGAYQGTWFIFTHSI